MSISQIDTTNHNLTYEEYIVDGSRLSEETLRWESTVQSELRKQGLDEEKWTIWVLGIIQTESGGKSEKKPDIMQSSESIGLPMNSIGTPEESISVGIQSLASRISLAEQYGISDIKAILQGYNFGSAYLRAMHNAGKKEYDIQFAEKYSKEIVYPAVTGKSANTAVKADYNAPWSQEVGKPYYWKNGGNFHYPNIVFYYVSGGVVSNHQVFGKFSLPFAGAYKVTDEFGMRLHPTQNVYKMHAGIDVVGLNDKVIRSIASGKVVQSEYNSGWGNYVVVDHGLLNNERYYSLYGHMSSPGTRAGVVVNKGDILGKEGATGDVTGSHLHLEIIQTNPIGSWSGGKRINPRLLIKF